MLKVKSEEHTTKHMLKVKSEEHTTKHTSESEVSATVVNLPEG